MPNPKRRHSKTRRDKRRTHDALSAGDLDLPSCGEAKMPHRVCRTAGRIAAAG
jgi:large subunit ribosomal protein L32